MVELALPGCRSTPLLSYLQGLGVLRVLHNQHDRGVISCWQASTLHLQSGLDREGLVEFLLHRYQPTPIVSPWNGGGGFRTREPQKGERAVQRITDNSDPRFDRLREAIDCARKVIKSAQQAGWVNDEGSATAQTKPLLMAMCRSAFPDEALDWLDAAFVLSDDKKPNYPLLLGTGGNLGRGDLSVNYMEALDQLLDPDHRPHSRSLLTHALFGEGNPELADGLVGQFLPGAAGTINSSAFGSATSSVNLWSFVLGIEGTLLFASGVARRFRGSKGVATTPFTVSTSSVGYSASAKETVKGELWLPIWEKSMTLAEVRRILAEGRLSWDGRHASNGVDAAKAIGTLGVDRGLSHFERYVVATRYGNMTLAVPVESFTVARQPAERVQALRELDPWLNRIRRTTLPASARSAFRRVDTAQMRVVRLPGDAKPLQSFLAEVAMLEWIISRNPDLRTRARSPIPPLSLDRWEALLDDGTTEWKLAVSLGTQRDRFNTGRNLSRFEQRRGAAACFLRPVKLHAEPHRQRWLDWGDQLTGSANPVASSTDDKLSTWLTHRAMLCGDRQTADGVTTIGSGAPIAFDWSYPVPTSYISAFLSGPLDRELLGRLISVAAMLDRPPKWKRFIPDRDGAQSGQALSPARALLGPFFHAQPLAIEAENGEDRDKLLLPSLSWPQKLRAGQSHSVFSEALTRLRSAGYRPGVRPNALQIASHKRLVASLLIPTFPHSIRNHIEVVCPPAPDPTTEGET